MGFGEETPAPVWMATAAFDETRSKPDSLRTS